MFAADHDLPPVINTEVCSEFVIPAKTRRLARL
jgi:hypothetical protein